MSASVPGIHTCDPSAQRRSDHLLYYQRVRRWPLACSDRAHDNTWTAARTSRVAAGGTRAAIRSAGRRDDRLGAGVRVRPGPTQSRTPGGDLSTRRWSAQSRAAQRTGSADRGRAAPVRRRGSRPSDSGCRHRARRVRRRAHPRPGPEGQRQRALSDRARRHQRGSRDRGVSGVARRDADAGRHAARIGRCPTGGGETARCASRTRRTASDRSWKPHGRNRADVRREQGGIGAVAALRAAQIQRRVSLRPGLGRLSGFPDQRP